MNWKLNKKAENYFMKAYGNDSQEVQKKTKLMLYFDLLLLPVLVFYLIADLSSKSGKITWVFVGDFTFIIFLGISLLCIKKHKPLIATNLFLGSYVNIFFTFCLGGYLLDSEYGVEGVLITISFLLVAFIVFSLLVLKKTHFIVHGIICNFIAVFQYFYILEKNQLGLFVEFDILFYSLILLNLIIFVSTKVFDAYHRLLFLLEKDATALTQILESFVPICANCKSIRVGHNGQEEWQEIEQYLTESSKKVQLTHSICKKCQKILYPEIDFSEELN